MLGISKNTQGRVVQKQNEAAESVGAHKPIRLIDLLTVLSVVIIWGVAFVGMKEMVHNAPPFKAAGIRFMLGAMPLMVLALQPSRLRKLGPKDFAKFSLLAFLMTTVLFGINFTALQFVPAGVTSIILNTNPFFVALFAQFLIPGDKITKQKMLGLTLGFSGVLALVLGGKGLGEVAPYWPVLLLVSASVWGLGSVLVKKFQISDMISLTAWQSFLGSIPLLILGYTTESQSVNWNWSFIGWTFYVAFLGSSFAWWAWYKVLQRYNASRITVFLFLVPVFGVLSGVILLHEALGINTLLGGLLVATGIVVVNSRQSIFTTLTKLVKK